METLSRITLNPDVMGGKPYPQKHTPGQTSLNLIQEVFIGRRIDLFSVAIPYKVARPLYRAMHNA